MTDRIDISLMEALGQSSKISTESACPWCGSLDITLHDDEGMYWCHCNGCGAEGPPALSEELAIESWEGK